jgi:hypothetical protein
MRLMLEALIVQPRKDRYLLKYSVAHFNVIELQPGSGVV